jgi:dTDP-4-dehydrorhamnose 3,5-epimerase
MELFETSIPEVILFKPRVFSDTRGSFFESYNQNSLKTIGITSVFVQDNQSESKRGVLRGLHYQTGEHAQAKLVRVLQGEVFDVAVDIRIGSGSYGKCFGTTLSAANGKQMYIPRGFAHGFLVLSDTAVFAYKCDNFYAKESEGGIIWNDPSIHIDWGIDQDQILLSEKDELLPPLENCRNDFMI